MDFTLHHNIQVLERTPQVLKSMLYGLDEAWTQSNEGGETWSPFDVVGHLVYCDEANWIPRARLILSGRGMARFEPLDRVAQFGKSQGKTLNMLLDEFAMIRSVCLKALREMNLTEQHLSQTALHPELGTVNLGQLLATWTVHDLDHVAQISRVMAKQYKHAVGPWAQYLRVLNQNNN